MAKLYANTFFINQISEDDKKLMFHLFQSYYDNISFEKFKKDLSNKDKVIVIKDHKEHKIRGFSTLQRIEVVQNSKKIIGLFSGDTVIDSNFWGGTALSMEFFINVMLTKLKNPTKEVYWFLISKGYKTYLLLANNFKNYYPRFDQPTPLKEKEIISAFAHSMYQDDLFDEDSMVLNFAHKYDKLKSTVAPISQELLLTNPKVAFFEKMNPDWENGNELCCIGKIDIELAWHFLNRTLKKQMKRTRLIPTNA